MREARDGACVCRRVRGACRRPAADDPEFSHQPALHADLGAPRRRLFVATVEGCFAGFGRAMHFMAPPDAPSNVAPQGYGIVAGLLVDPGWRRRGVWASP